jgi:osmotically-inducible protein OsmY
MSQSTRPKTTPGPRPKRAIASFAACAALVLAADGSLALTPVADTGSPPAEARQMQRLRADASIRRDVLLVLAELPSINRRAISVFVNRGIVTLRGTVPTFGDRARAEKSVSAIPGVRLVINQLEIAGPIIKKSVY